MLLYSLRLPFLGEKRLAVRGQGAPRGSPSAQPLAASPRRRRAPTLPTRRGVLGLESLPFLPGTAPEPPGPWGRCSRVRDTAATESPPGCAPGAHARCVAWDLRAGRAAARTLALEPPRRRPSGHPSSVALTPPLPLSQSICLSPMGKLINFALD